MATARARCSAASARSPALLAASRAGDLDLAAEHLALAVAMRPDLGHYSRALRGVRARRGGENP